MLHGKKKLSPVENIIDTEVDQFQTRSKISYFHTIQFPVSHKASVVVTDDDATQAS